MAGFIGLFDTARGYTLQDTVTHTHTHTHTHTSVQSRLHQPLFSSGFQRWTFPFLWVLELSPASATSFSQQQLTTTELQQSSNSLTDQLQQSQSYFTTVGLPPISSS
jgi:hypothetical protein